MARKCSICGRESSTGFMYSHSHRRTKRRWRPNIQKIRALIDGAPKRVNVCTRCLKKGKVQKAI